MSYYSEHRDKLIEYKRNYRIKNREKLNKQARDNHLKNPEKARDSFKEYYYKNIEKIRYKSKNFLKKNYETNLIWLEEYTEGLKCARCGYEEFFCSIDGHHLEPNQKKNIRDSLKTWLRQLNLEQFKIKIKSTKFLLLCRNCHTSLENGKWDLKDISMFRNKKFRYIRLD